MGINKCIIALLSDASEGSGECGKGLSRVSSSQYPGPDPNPDSIVEGPSEVSKYRGQTVLAPVQQPPVNCYIPTVLCDRPGVMRTGGAGPNTSRRGGGLLGGGIGGAPPPVPPRSPRNKSSDSGWLKTTKTSNVFIEHLFSS